MSNLRKSDPSELQTRNGQEHVRVYNPTSERLMFGILEELKKMNTQLSLITEVEL